MARLDADHAIRLATIIQSCWEKLPLLPDRQMAFVDLNLIPHVEAMADEWAIREKQLDAFKAECDRLRTELAALRNPWRNVADELPSQGEEVAIRRVVNGLAEHRLACLESLNETYWFDAPTVLRLADYPEWMPLP
jgi:hypothetical protein